MSQDKMDAMLGYSFDAWKQSIEVQRHFNDMCMKIRNLYITVLSALIAFLGLILSELNDPFFRVGMFSVHTSLVLLFSIVAATYLFYFIDRHWYHRLLVGAVQNAIEIEKSLKDKIPGIQLTYLIGENSPLDVSEKTPGATALYWLARIFGSDRRVKKDKKIHSDAKISMFYKSVGIFFVVIFVAIAFGGGIKKADLITQADEQEIPSAQG